MKIASGLIAIAIVGAMPCAAFEIKGVFPGQSKSDLLVLYPGLQCLERIKALPICHYAPHLEITHSLPEYKDGPFIPALNTFAGVTPTRWIFSLLDGVVGSIGTTFSANQFDQVVGAIEEKYGKPTKRQESIVKTRAGVEYQQTDIEWSADGQELYVQRRSDNVEISSIVLSSDSYRAFLAGQEAARKHAGAKDL